MKISWGYKIAGVYLLFVAGIVFLVFKANNERFDMVTKDYYGEELKYQQVIDQSANANALSAPVSVERNEGAVTVRFPIEMKDKKIDVDFYLYYPADDKKDFRKSFTINAPEFNQSLPEGAKGLYELKLSWTADGKKYYNERKIFL
ncbi:MAG: hypothetical protein E6H07_09010 [Bacteroidetes bacterium]|nr:MAG: hypothetical protein E6H07_09010 [Bacteroidota bacterium]